MSYLKKFISLCLILTVFSQIHGHGFVGETFISVKNYTQVHAANNLDSNGFNAWQMIAQIYDYANLEYLRVKSYDIDQLIFTYQGLKVIGISDTNCYYRLKFDEHELHDLVCTPAQEFYVLANNDANRADVLAINLAAKKGWVPACMLQVGDVLLCDHGNHNHIDLKNQGLPITNIEFVKQSCPVYTLEVEPYHTYLVGANSIVTHNMALESYLLFEFSIAFGEGAIAGSQLGSFFGPVTWGAGLCIGGVLGVGALYCCNGSNRTSYRLKFNADRLDQLAKHKTKKQVTNNKHSGSNHQDPKKDDHQDNVTIPPIFNKKDQQVTNTLAGPHGTYNKAPYHGKYGNDIKGPAPKNGQKALDNSFLFKEKGNTNYQRRVAAVDGEYVVLDETGRKEFHGHTRTWKDFKEDMQDVLIDNGIVNKKGKIL